MSRSRIGEPISGTIRRRLLVNRTVDPDEAASRLPARIRPHVTDAGTVVGCCLLEITHVRPHALPAGMGVTLRAAAHRISAEWDTDEGTVVGVYVPVRHTDSRLAVTLGGRWFPGVHHPARIDVRATHHRLCWTVETDCGGDLDIRVQVSKIPGELEAAEHPVGVTCLTAAVGVSPGRDATTLEAVRMDVPHYRAQHVLVDELDAGFLDRFVTAQAAPSFLVEDVGVTWRRGAAPTSAPALAR